MATPHISANLEDIAPVVIMPGDPLRAKFIAEKFLKDAKEVNKVRNILAYTGLYNGKRVTIFASGMGNASMGIYAYELYNFYNVETIIRVGSCGAFKEEHKIMDMILATSSVSDSSFAKVFNGSTYEKVSSNMELNNHILEIAHNLKYKIHPGPVYSSDVFYNQVEKSSLVKKYCLAVEMETFALFTIAKHLNKKATAILTISDSFVTKEETTSLMREKGFTDMMELALKSI